VPFTGAHPLAIVPFARVRWLDATSLAIGAMAPDFMYFARGELRGNFGHTALGLAVWCVPITLACGLLFHELVKWSLLLAAPRAIAARLVTAARAPWPARLAALVPSAILGAITHVVWDGFTHAEGFAVRRIAALRTVVTVPILGTTAVHRVLQHGSTVVGLAGLAVVVGRWYARQPEGVLPDVPRAWPRAVVAGCLALGIAALGVRAWWRHAWSLGDLVVAPISGSLAGLIIAGLVLRPITRSAGR